jgi:hypothetical protein
MLVLDVVVVAACPKRVSADGALQTALAGRAGTNPNPTTNLKLSPPLQTVLRAVALLHAWWWRIWPGSRANRRMVVTG